MTRRTIRTATACSALAFATSLAFAAAPAMAQTAPSGSFQGSSTVTFGSATVTQGTGTTDVQVDSTSAVIDWTPTDTAINNGTPIIFQPAGTTATFHNNSQTFNNFALLNRIVPADASRPIQFNGNVISRLQTAAGQVAGGTVFFYSPGGIIVGANAVFDVGNLGLTSAPPVVDANGNWYTGNTVQFGQAASNSFVRINPGAQISAIAEGSYVAAFAPSIVQNGTIDVNGQAALVAGEAGTITFSPDGLFNIQVTIGTDSTFAIDHSGTTGGSTASSGPGDNHRVYMVAIPKNQAIQIAIGRGSQIGFDIAGAADTVGNAVVLSAGHNVTGGQVDTGVSGGATADISINDSASFGSGTGIDFTSAVSGYASGHVFVDVFRQTNFASDALLQANDGVQVAVSQLTEEPAGALTVAGNLTLSAQRRAPVAGDDADAGNATLFAFDGGTIDVGGDLTINAITTFDGNGDGAAQGGSATFQASGGSAVNVGGALRVDASSYAGFDSSAPDAIGGNASVGLFGGSSLTTGGVARIYSYGIAGNNNGLGGNGADGLGGFSGIFVSEGSSATVLELNIAADGVGGADTGTGSGAGTGGTAHIVVDGADSTLTVQQFNQTGNFFFGELDLLSAEGFGGATRGLGSTVGGTGTGGSASIFVTNGGTATLPNDPGGNLVRVIARGTGGRALADGTTGGDGVGGNLSIVLNNGTLTVEKLLPSLAGLGGNANASATGTINGGDGIGGSRNIQIVNGSTFTGSIIGGQSGGAGGSANANGTGGDGSGGFDSFLLDNSTLNVTGKFIVIGQTVGGSGLVGGSATAGTVNALITNGSTVTIASGFEFSFSSNAFGGTDVGGNGTVGGAATGGIVQVTVQDSTISGPGAFGAVAVGVGGVGGAQGGAGTGGAAILTVNNSTISVTEIGAIADGTGGALIGNANSAGGASGNGTGGVAGVNVTDATLTVDIIDVSAEGKAGIVDAAGFASLIGGTGTGGIAFFQALGGTTTVTAGDLRVDGSGSGGLLSEGSGTGGNGFGGQAFVRASNGAFTINGPVAVVANGSGASAQDGGTGGTGTSGTADVTANAASLTINGSLAVDASSTGGAGTTGGAATFGTAPNQVVVNADNGTLALNGPVLLTANALGGAGTTGNGGAANAGAVLVIAQNNGTIDLLFETNADAFATGGATIDGIGGAASGGRVTYLAQSGGTILLNNPNANLTADSQATGGSASGLGDGGSATAGSTAVRAAGGTISITGNLGMASDATGGNGINGGNASGSINQFILVNTFLHALGGGSIEVLGSTGMTSFIAGGFGSDGGAGGGAVGGTVVILAQTNTASSLASRIALHDVFAINESVGGDGGSSSTGAGGAGGSGTGGRVEVLGDAGNGQLTIDGDITLESFGTGGTGGDGTTGGAGGNAIGGAVTFGTRSGAATTDNTGRADFNGDVFAAAIGVGGDGGTGSSGTGGAGGDGTYGGALILVRGSPVTIAGSAQLFAAGLGGAGGTGSAGDGAGGDGIAEGAGGIGIIASGRFNLPDNRGSLTANTITGQAFAQGGTGSTPGASLIGNQSALIAFTNADANIGSLNFSVSGATVVGTAPNLISLTDATVNVTDFSFFSANDLALALDGATLNTGNFFVQSRAVVLPASAPAVAGTITATSGLQILVGSGGSIRTYANFVTDFGVSFVVDGDFQTGDFTAAGDINIESLNGTVTTGNLSGGSITLFAAQDITAGDIDANGDIVLRSQSGTVNVGALSGSSLNLSSAQNVVLGDFTTSGAILLESLNGSVIAGNLVSGASLQISAGQDVTTGNLDSGAALNVTAGGNAALGMITAAGDALLNLQGALAVGNVQTGGRFSTFAQGDQAIGNVVAGNTVDIRGSSDITTGSIAGPASIYVLADGGDLSTGDISAGDPALTDGRRFGIGLRGGSVTTGDLATPGTVIAAAVSGSMTIGNVSSDRSVLLFAAQNVSGGGVSAGTDPGEILYVGNPSDLSRLGAGDDFSQVIAADPAPTGGSVTFGGPVTADTVLVAAGGAFTAGAITSTARTAVEAGGLASFTGRVSGGAISVTSSDIEIASTGSLQAPGGTVTLVSINQSQAIIGDVANPASGAYRLDNGEFGRISGGSVEIYALDNSEQAIDMLIGDLTITGPNAGSTIEDSEGYLLFATGVSEDEDPSGAIRIVGAVSGTGFGPANEIKFNTGIFEIDAATGSLRVEDSPGTLGGIVDIEADHIHIAGAEILERLRQDPLYEGRANDLNQPGNIDRPEGVISALGLEFYPGRTLYIQNTGTASEPAGFFATLENSDIEPPGFENSEAPPVDVIINGRFQTASGDISGRAAFDAIVANAEGFAGFTDTSQINGCVFSTGACAIGFVDEGMPPPVSSAEIDVLTEDQAEEEPFDTEEEEEDEDEASSPIAPPVVLINTRALNPDVDVTDPVSGTGNPALIDASLSDGPPQGDEQ